MLIHIFDAEAQVLRALVTEVTGCHKWRRLDAAYLINAMIQHTWKQAMIIVLLTEYTGRTL
jgi:hypothetical protein